jgi:hypothetical protein
LLQDRLLFNLKNLRSSEFDLYQLQGEEIDCQPSKPTALLIRSIGAKPIQQIPSERFHAAANELPVKI